MLFGDFHGFGRLRDEQFPAFVHGVLGAVADALWPFEPASVCCEAVDQRSLGHRTRAGSNPHSSE